MYLCQEYFFLRNILNKSCVVGLRMRCVSVSVGRGNNKNNSSTGNVGCDKLLVSTEFDPRHTRTHADVLHFYIDLYTHSHKGSDFAGREPTRTYCPFHELPEAVIRPFFNILSLIFGFLFFL